MTDQPTLFDAHFDGATYDPAKDKPRLKGQLYHVWRAMNIHGGWWTIDQLVAVVSRATGKRATHQSISARIRDLRKPKFGGHTVEHRRRADGLWEYRLHD